MKKMKRLLSAAMMLLLTASLPVSAFAQVYGSHLAQKIPM